MAFSARVLLDSISGAGARLTTMEARYPRFIHSELMTHRVFCLEADTRLYFDLPSRQGDTKRFTMTIAEFHEKWHTGAKQRPHKARRGSDLLRYARGGGEHHFSLRGRLEKMNLRSCDDDTRVIAHTHVKDITFSGYLPVYRVTTADGKTIVASAEHRFLTPTGWSTLREATNLSLSVNGIATWNGEAQLGVNGVEALRNPDWLREMRDKGYSAQAIADQLNVSVDQVKYRFRILKIRATNPTEVWRRSHTKPPWNKGRTYCNLKLRGVPTRARVRRGEERHFWKGGMTPEPSLIGIWTQGQAFRLHQRNMFRCEMCGGSEKHAHHVDPVVHNLRRADDTSNLASVCQPCHGRLHYRNLELKLLEHVESGRSLASFWSAIGDVQLRRPFRTHRKRTMVAHFVDIIAIEYVGIRPTYDLEVVGPHHNFVADGFVVHNSRNAASSRAIPIKKMIETVREDPAMPVFWGRNQAGMSAREEIDPQTLERAQLEWRRALDDALTHAQRLTQKDIDLHKQLVNRLLEPFAWITVIITATEWSNFFTQRCHPDAQPEIKHVAELMLEAYRNSKPGLVPLGEWHLPLIQDDERTLSNDVLCKLSVARCARVSYLTHEGRRDHEKDLELFERLLGGGANGHWSPFEHVATPLADPAGHSGNFVGWEQYRKRFPQENAAVFPERYSTVDR